MHEWCMDFFPSVAVFKSTQTCSKLREHKSMHSSCTFSCTWGKNPCTHSCTWGKHPCTHSCTWGKNVHAPIHALGTTNPCTFSCTFSYTFLRNCSIEKSFFYSYTGSAELARLSRWQSGRLPASCWRASLIVNIPMTFSDNLIKATG